ncbi:MAG: EF-P lysine aminoacylase EpmA [Steroidobacteraceae bacterium]
MGMNTAAADWRPTASIATLRRRAALVAAVRGFFGARGLLEVDTPVVVAAAVSDVHLASMSLAAPARGFLHTSPEYAMKRLLAAGSGDIWQLCHVMRGDERSRLHNSEFTLLEWYRIGYDMQQLIGEVVELVEHVMAAATPGAPPPSRSVELLTYQAAFGRVLGLDPLEAPLEALRAAAASGSVAPDTLAALTRDELLDLLLAVAVGPALGQGRWTFLTHWPASQAALARLDPADPRVAHRFELYADGVELANGFHELLDDREQRARFEADRTERRRRGLPDVLPDEHLLAALAAGLPDCAGVALGFDRLAMLALGAARIDDVIIFAADRA